MPSVWLPFLPHLIVQWSGNSSPTDLALKIRGLKPFLRRLPRPTRSGGFYLVVGSVLGVQGWAQGDNYPGNLLILLAAGLFGFVFANGLVAALMIRKLGAKLSVPESIRCGESGSLRLTISNRGRFLPRIGLALQIKQSQGIALITQEQYLTLVKAGEKAPLRFAFKALSRGRRSFREFRVSSSFPFGLVKVSRRIAIKGDLIAYPAKSRLPSEVLEALSHNISGHGGRIRHRSGLEDFRGLREYHPGDALSHIHWRTSARAAKAMILELEDQGIGAVRVLVDSHASTDRNDANLVFERSIRLAASLVDEAMRQGLLCGVRSFDTSVIVHPESTGDAHYHRVMSSLALLKSGSTSLRVWRDAASEGLQAATALFVVSSRPQDIIQRELEGIPLAYRVLRPQRIRGRQPGGLLQ